MSFEQRGDALCYITPDGIEINIQDGLTEMGWFESAINLCLTAGNMKDDVTPSTKKYEYMGNEDEETAYRFRSRFLSMLNGRPLSSQLIKDLAVAASLDLVEGFGDYIETATCNVSIDTVDSVTVTSLIEMADGRTFTAENRFYK